MTNLIVDLQYFPPVILYKNLNNFSNIVFEQYESYQKMSFRNRCQILGADGVLHLTVPLHRGRDQKTLLKEVRIASDTDWQARHWKTLLSCYSRSPWFEFYRDELEALYRRPYRFLLDWNIACFEWSLGALPLPVPFSLTEAYQARYDPVEWIDWRGKWSPASLTKSALGNLAPSNPDDSPAVRYTQVFEDRTGFIPNLSIVDLLFCEGKRARLFLV
jgi:hypothetical protein